MGLFRASRDQQERERLKVMNPYVFIPEKGEVVWLRWNEVPPTEEIGALPKCEGLPVLMTMEECAGANSDCGILPDFWDDIPCAWRNEAQKRDFYATYPERFNRKHKVTSGRSAYPTPEQIAEFLEAHRKGGAEAIAALLREKQAQKEQQEPIPDEFWRMLKENPPGRAKRRKTPWGNQQADTETNPPEMDK